MRELLVTILALLAAGCDAETASLIDWHPCDDAATCSNVPPLNEKLVPYDEIIGYRQGDDLTYLYWWHLVPHGTDEFRADSVRVLPIMLGPRNLSMEGD